jgi:hypothetical protein
MLHSEIGRHPRIHAKLFTALASSHPCASFEPTGSALHCHNRLHKLFSPRHTAIAAGARSHRGQHNTEHLFSLLMSFSTPGGSLMLIGSLLPSLLHWTLGNAVVFFSSGRRVHPLRWQQRLGHPRFIGECHQVTMSTVVLSRILEKMIRGPNRCSTVEPPCSTPLYVTPGFKDKTRHTLYVK